MQRLNVTPGTLYDYAPTTIKTIDGQAVTGRHPQGRYEVLHMGHDVRTMQDVVIYRGIAGRGKGMWFVTTIADFAVRFLPVDPPPAPPAEVPVVLVPWDPWQKVAGRISRDGEHHGAKQFQW